MRPATSVLVSLCLVCTSAAADPLERLHWLVGSWDGEGQGVSAGARQQREVLCALDCRYLNVESRSITGQAVLPIVRNDAGEGPMPTALGMWTVAAGGRRLVLHTFDPQASVTTYEEQPGGAQGPLVLLAQWRPGRADGWRARFSYRFQPPDAFHERFEVAHGPGAWQLVAEHTFRRRSGSVLGPG